MFKRWLNDEGGATAIEYALIASIMGIMAIAGLQALGNSTNGLFARVGTAFNTYIPK